MRFFVIIGKNALSVYEKNGNSYEKQFIEGSPSYPYDVNHVEEHLDHFLNALANEKNLGTRAKLEFDILENKDPIRTNSVLRILGDYTKDRQKLSDTIQTVIKKLARDKSLWIDTYGINYDGECYRMEGQKLQTHPFDLLAYTVEEDDMMELL